MTFTAFMFAERVVSGQAGPDSGRPGARRASLRIVRSITRRVNRYLLVKSAISLATALLIWMIFRAAGLELAGAVAMLTFILNFIPTIGSIIATVIAVVPDAGPDGRPDADPADRRPLHAGAIRHRQCAGPGAAGADAAALIVRDHPCRWPSGARSGDCRCLSGGADHGRGHDRLRAYPVAAPIAVLLSHEGLPDEDDTHPPESLARRRLNRQRPRA